MSKEILLSNSNKTFIVDDEDFDRINNMCPWPITNWNHVTKKLKDIIHILQDYY